MRAISAIFHALAAAGVGVTAVHVLPSIWEANVFDAIVVCGSLTTSGALMLNRALTGRWI